MPTDLIVDALATFRLTRLIVSDSITATPRHALQQWLLEGGHVKAFEFTACPWCVGQWVAFGVVIARKVAPKVWHPVACALAFSAVTGILAEST